MRDLFLIALKPLGLNVHSAEEEQDDLQHACPVVFSSMQVAYLSVTAFFLLVHPNVEHIALQTTEFI